MLTAFVVVSLGGFGSVPGAVIAGLLIGVIEALSAYLIGAGLQGRGGVRPVRRGPVGPAAGPDGEDRDAGAMALVPDRAARWRFAYPLLSRRRSCSVGALVLLWRSAPGPGISSAAMRARCRSGTRCSSAPAPTRAAAIRCGAPPLVGLPLGVVVSVVIALVIGTPTFRLQGHYFSMATIAVAELVRLMVGNTDLLGAAVGIRGRPCRAAVWDLSSAALPYYYIFLAVLALTVFITWAMARSRIGYYLRAIRAGERAASASGCRSAAPSSGASCSAPRSPASPARSMRSRSASSIRKAGSASWSR